MGNYETTKAWRARKKQEDPEAFRAYRAAEAQKRRTAHREEVNICRRDWRHKNADRINAVETPQARIRRGTPEYQAASRLRTRKYKEKRKQEQEQIAGRPRPRSCEICGEFHLRIVFDHCHESGIFRGLLCDRCNKTLGLVHDSEVLLRKLAQYLDDGRNSNGKINHEGPQRN